MIPKIIHYSWFSNDPIPAHIQSFIDNWKVIMPDYEYVLWDGDMLSKLNNQFANEAISVKKWAFASDFLRLYAIYNFGGIWFDTDLEVFKPFDIFLDNRVFIANEAGAKGFSRKFHWLTGHCFGAEKHHPFIKECLDFYTNRRFIRTENLGYSESYRYDMVIIPEIMCEVAKRYGYDDNGFIDKEQNLLEGIKVLPSYVLDKPMYNSMKEVFSIHREAGSWRADNFQKLLNYEGTNPKKFKLIYFLKIFFQRLSYKFGYTIIRVR